MLINLFQRYYLWTFLVLSGLLGLALANLTTTVISSSEDTSPAVSLSAPQPEAKTTAKQKNLASYQPIIANNIFSPAQRNRAEKLSSSPGKKTSSVSTKWTLLGTVSGGMLPLATLSDGTTTETYTLDEELPDGATIEMIDRSRVELRYPDGRTATLEIQEDAGKAPVTATRSRATAPKGSEYQIEDLGENRWRIPLPLVEESRENMGELLKQARVVPYLKDGKTAGFQIRMLRSKSLFANIGLRRGDILHRINGLELDSPEKALQIFGQLRQARQINIDLERRGKAMTFAYEIR